ncbi:hypothetical protein PG989_000024 [Apiospora arundinis]
MPAAAERLLRKLLTCSYFTTEERLKQRVQSLQSSLNNHAALWNFLLEIPEENIVQVLHDAQAAPDLESYLAKARGDASTLQGRRPSSDFGTTASLDPPHEN